MTGKRQVPVGMEPVGRDAPARRVERELRREVAAHFNGAAYIGDGSAARAIVRRGARR